MELNVEEFFKPVKIRETINVDDYKIASTYVSMAEAFARTTYQSVYLIDYNRRGFLYVSDNPLFLCGYTAEKVKQLGYLFYFKQVPKEDLELLLKINEAGFKFYEKIPSDEKLLYTISYDFHLRHPHDKLVLVNHKLTPVALDKNLNIWLSLCVVSLSSQKTVGNIRLRKRNDSIVYEYYKESNVWKKREEVKLTDREKEILYLSAQGCTTNEIANKIFLSVDTIKFHKRQLFEKLEVRNITEAVSCASSYGVI